MVYYQNSTRTCESAKFFTQMVQFQTYLSSYQFWNLVPKYLHLLFRRKISIHLPIIPSHASSSSLYEHSNSISNTLNLVYQRMAYLWLSSCFNAFCSLAYQFPQKFYWFCLCLHYFRVFIFINPFEILLVCNVIMVFVELTFLHSYFPINCFFPYSFFVMVFYVLLFGAVLRINEIMFAESWCELITDLFNQSLTTYEKLNSKESFLP